MKKHTIIHLDPIFSFEQEIQSDEIRTGQGLSPYTIFQMVRGSQKRIFDLGYKSGFVVGVCVGVAIAVIPAIISLGR